MAYAINRVYGSILFLNRIKGVVVMDKQIIDQINSLSLEQHLLILAVEFLMLIPANQANTKKLRATYIAINILFITTHLVLLTNHKDALNLSKNLLSHR